MWQEQEHGAIKSLSVSFSLQLEGQNGRLLHKLLLVQLQKNVHCVLVIREQPRLKKKKFSVCAPSGLSLLVGFLYKLITVKQQNVWDETN